MTDRRYFRFTLRGIFVMYPHLQAQELLLHHDVSGSLLDNFLDEMLEFAAENDVKIRCFVAAFIEKAWFVFRSSWACL